MRLIKVYDTTLRDGTQAEDISFSCEDKIRIAEKLDEMGIHYIEGGWPGSNPKDADFFMKIKKVPLANSKIAAFGSTRRPGIAVEDDENVKALLRSETQVLTIFGKSWDLHVNDALEITCEENLDLIFDTVEYLKDRLPEVIYDAEHFFDGYKNNPSYAMKTIEAAQDAGADCIVLCDTNGGTMPYELEQIIERVKPGLKKPFGIHTHNDAEMAVANTIAAVRLGAEHIQGTINGYGERCGNANLCSILPNIKFKLNCDCISAERIKGLRNLSQFVNEIANIKGWSHQPYVGKSAFAHKGGVHVSAVIKNSQTYEHIEPDLVGNTQRVLVSDLSGKGNILYKADQFNIDLDGKNPATKKILAQLKELENRGFQFEAAEGSFELLMRKALGTRKKYFDLKGFRVIVEKGSQEKEPLSEATIMLMVDGDVEHTAAMGHGPVNALDNALRKGLEKFYPRLKEMTLIDYKVRILEEKKGTAAKTRVLIESGDGTSRWGTVGVSDNIIEASWQALVDSIDYKLHKDEFGAFNKEEAWGNLAHSKK